MNLRDRWRSNQSFWTTSSTLPQIISSNITMMFDKMEKHSNGERKYLKFWSEFILSLSLQPVWKPEAFLTFERLCSSSFSLSVRYISLFRWVVVDYIGEQVVARKQQKVSQRKLPEKKSSEEMKTEIETEYYCCIAIWILQLRTWR